MTHNLCVYLINLDQSTHFGLDWYDKSNAFIFVELVENNVPPLLVSCEVRNFLFSVKDKNSCETRTRTYHKIRNCEKRLLADSPFTFFRKFINSEYYILFSFQKD